MPFVADGEQLDPAAHHVNTDKESRRLVADLAPAVSACRAGGRKTTVMLRVLGPESGGYHLLGEAQAEVLEQLGPHRGVERPS